VITSVVVGVAGGLVAALCLTIGSVTLWSGGAVGVALAGGAVVPSLYALLWLRLPGAALVSGAVAALIVGGIAFTLLAALIGMVLIGAAVELPYLVTRYRRWSSAEAATAGAVGGLCAGPLVLPLWNGSFPATSIPVLLLPALTGTVLGALVHAIDSHHRTRTASYSARRRTT
jgi:energy-coupling factor transport system substrate-specific component